MCCSKTSSQFFVHVTGNEAIVMIHLSGPAQIHTLAKKKKKKNDDIQRLPVTSHDYVHCLRFIKEGELHLWPAFAYHDHAWLCFYCLHFIKEDEFSIGS